MAKRKTVDLDDLSIPELVVKLGEAKEEAFNLRFRHATGQLDNTARLRESRKDIARINTVLRQREIAAAEEKS
jgi:large subunit ribosomal protein L29